MKRSIKSGLVALAVAVVSVAGVSSCGSSSNLGTILSTIGSAGTVANVFSSVIGLDKVTQQTLIGTWNYNGPGCAFTSENLLAKAGGEVAATKIEKELEPYYTKAGITQGNTRITFNSDNTFTAVIAGKTLQGNYAFDEAQAKVTLQTLLLNMPCYVKREYGGISVLFESKKLLTVLQTMATLSGNQTAQTIGDISKNYDGVRIGFDMKH